MVRLRHVLDEKWKNENPEHAAEPSRQPTDHALADHLACNNKQEVCALTLYLASSCM